MYVVTNLGRKGARNGKYKIWECGDFFVSRQNGESQERKLSMKRNEHVTDNFKRLICG